MTKHELNKRTEAVITETRTALMTVYNALNSGQKKKLTKDEAVKQLFDKYGVNVEE